RWRYQLHYRTPDGRLHRDAGTPRINSEKAAKHAAVEHIARIRRPATAEERADSPTFAKVAADYLAAAANWTHIKPTDVEGKRQKLVWLKDWIGERPIGELTHGDVDRVRAKLAPYGLAVSTVNNYLSVIGAVLDYAVDCRLITTRPRLGLSRPKNKRKLDKVYSAAEVDALLTKHRGDVMATCAVLLGFDAGLRAGEIRALRRVDIDAERGVIHVEHAMYSVKGSCDAIGTPKNGTGRIVGMSKRLASAIDAALKSHASPSVLVRTVGASSGGGRWARFEGTRWTKESMRRYQPPKGWHALRHGFCTTLAERGATALEIMLAAGHASIATSERYIHGSAERAAARVAALLDEPAPRRARKAASRAEWLRDAGGRS